MSYHSHFRYETILDILNTILSGKMIDTIAYAWNHRSTYDDGLFGCLQVSGAYEEFSILYSYLSVDSDNVRNLRYCASLLGTKILGGREWTRSVFNSPRNDVLCACAVKCDSFRWKCSGGTSWAHSIAVPSVTRCRCGRRRCRCRGHRCAGGARQYR